MPFKPPKPCAWPGCPNLTHERYCEQHRKKASMIYEKTNRNQTMKKFYNSPAWLTLRKMKLSRNPLCEICKQEDRIITATCVDHITELSCGGGALDIDNLQSLCQSCHSRKTLQERNKR